MRKLFLILAISTVLALSLAFTVSAVELSDTVSITVGDTTQDVALFDADGNALIWYWDAQNNLASIRTDDPQVKWYTESWGEVTSVSIAFDDGTKVSSGKFIVVNMIDDDVVKNSGPGTSHYGGLITGFKLLFANCKSLEYVYLRTDTTGIYRQSFENCTKLKYINLEDLTLLSRIGDGGNFSNCTSLFEGEILDLSKTRLTTIDNGSSFNSVPMAGVIFPSTLKTISSKTFQNSRFESLSWPTTVTVIEGAMFKNNSSLESICLSNSLTKIDGEAFLGCTSLSKIFYVGTLDEFNALLANVNTTGNDPFFSVANGKKISYAEYQALADKSGSYVVYGYSWCEAYNEGDHLVEGQNPCVGFCNVCSCNVVSHKAGEITAMRIDYVDFSKAGVKTTYCCNEGCTYKAEEEVDAIFESLGYSVPENGKASITVGFLVNKVALEDFTDTGREFSYGVFAVLKDKLGDKDIFDENGEKAEGVLSAEIKNRSFDAFEIKVTGFADTQRDLKLAIGAYVVVTSGDTVEYSYVQVGEINEGEKYCFVSVNDID